MNGLDESNTSHLIIIVEEINHCNLFFIKCFIRKYILVYRDDY